MPKAAVSVAPAALLLLQLTLLGPAAAVAAEDRAARPAAPAAAASSAGREQAMAALPLFSPRLLSDFYREREPGYAWSRPQAESMLALAEASVAHGLEPADFHRDALTGLISAGVLESEPPDEAARWRVDLLLSDALLRYLHHLQYGKYNPRHINPDWTFVDSVDARALLDEMHAVLGADRLGAAVADVLPAPPFYEQLRAAYQRYLALADGATAPDHSRPIPSGVNLRIGMRDPRVALIRDRLSEADGYRFPASGDPAIYDRALYDAVREFQGRSGLAQDGIVGPRTLAALNQPLAERLAVIRANLERMRWLYHDLPPDYLLVDITAFRVELMRAHQPVWTARTIVGTGEDQTPMFRDEMEHLVFNPTWSVPISIQKEMRGVPSGYRVLERRSGRRVYPSDPTNYRRYRLVQQPGPRNALGRVKFMFPNGHAIYLHDTPSRHLFERSQRAYSHGCVRVDDPLELAEALLATPTWDMGAIRAVVDRGRTRYVDLDAPLPVLLYYLTARADAAGRVGFRPDLYQRDERLLAAMDGATDARRIVFTEPAESAEPTAASTHRETAASTTAAGGADDVDAARGAAAGSALTQEDRQPRPGGAESAPEPGLGDELPAMPRPAASDRGADASGGGASGDLAIAPWWGLTLAPEDESGAPLSAPRAQDAAGSGPSAGDGGSVYARRDRLLDLTPALVPMSGAD
jgi:murein L,D-transpeptidase YcbB/YkuD